jgi:hypothetical protein
MSEQEHQSNQVQSSSDSNRSVSSLSDLARGLARVTVARRKALRWMGVERNVDTRRTMLLCATMVAAMIVACSAVLGSSQQFEQQDARRRQRAGHLTGVGGRLDTATGAAPWRSQGDVETICLSGSTTAPLSTQGTAGSTQATEKPSSAPNRFDKQHGPANVRHNRRQGRGCWHQRAHQNLRGGHRRLQQR